MNRFPLTDSRRAVRFAASAAAAAALSVGATACSSGANADRPAVDTQSIDTASVDATPASTDHAHHGSEPIAVTVDGVDYGFEQLPDSIEAGTRLTFHNTAPTELHEMAIFRLPDDEDRPLDELVELPGDELTEILGNPATVLLQAPGSDEVIPAVGDGTLAEPGRYAVMCFIPHGADPDEYLRAAAESDGGPPQGIEGGAPHFALGMYAELEVTA